MWIRDCVLNFRWLKIPLCEFLARGSCVNRQLHQVYTWPSLVHFETTESIECVRVFKSKTKEPLKVLSSSCIRGSKFISVYNFPAQ